MRTQLGFTCSMGSHVSRNATVNLAQKKIGMEEWHRRLAHINPEKLRKMFNDGLVKGLKIDGSAELDFCEACQIGKQPKKPFPKKASRTKKILEIVHSEVCGPMPVKSLGGRRYFVTFIDDFSRFSQLYFMEQKSEVLSYTTI